MPTLVSPSRIYCVSVWATCYCCNSEMLSFNALITGQFEVDNFRTCLNEITELLSKRCSLNLSNIGLTKLHVNC